MSTKDENRGLGGSYVVRDGVRVLNERTAEPKDGLRARDEDGKPIHKRAAAQAAKRPLKKPPKAVAKPAGTPPATKG